MNKLVFTTLACMYLHVAVSQNVGIGTLTPTRAKLEVHGDITLGIFGGNGTGISLQKSWPTIGFNQYRDAPTGNGKSIGAGYAAHMALNVSTGVWALIMNGNTANPNAALPSQNVVLNVQQDGNVGIGIGAPNATLSVNRGAGVDGTAVFFGSTNSSHFNYSAAEDTYIRGGKNTSKVLINDYGGQVTIGTMNAGTAQLHVFSSRTGTGANGISVNQTATNIANDSYGINLIASGSNIRNHGIKAEVGGSGQTYNMAGMFRAVNATAAGQNLGVDAQAANSNVNNLGGYFNATGGIVSTINYGVQANASGPGDNYAVYGVASTSNVESRAIAIYGGVPNAFPGSDSYAGYFDGWVHMSSDLFGKSIYCTNLYESSDARLKKDITPISTSIGKILLINPVHYYWKDAPKDSQLQTGVLAQDIEKVYPELVVKDNKGMLAVNYVGLIPHLIKAIKELQLEIDLLKPDKLD